ncbi:MAG: cytochrome c oxidase accessory protein CcoG [Myxococcales bacterium]|nr:cytochrome c oxidase accessory protein CcoG [Myxococcales bacterium]
MKSLPVLSDPAKAPGPLPSVLRPDGKREPIFPLDVKGRFIRWRRVTFALLIAVYLAAPLVPVGGHPAIHLDIDARKFYLLGGTFNAQDFWIVLLLATSIVFGLLFVTAWRGRLWCGWACPQTVFLEGVFRPIERLIDGPRSRRLKMLTAPWSIGRALRALLKHTLYLLAAAAVAHVGLALFLSASDLLTLVREGPAAAPVAFAWALAITGLLYFNFAWFREQFCVVLCPYGRMQSVLHDKDSIVIGYDAARGEPRGPLRKDGAGNTQGHCVDCKKCIHVCPTAIDIRNGLQMECLACAQCIDVCDEVMEKVGRPKGLIRFASLNELAGGKRRVLRPRLVLYAALFILCFGGFTAAVAGRTPFEANVLRPPGVPWVLEGDRVRNQVEVHLVNKHSTRAAFTLRAESPIPTDVQLGAAHVELDSLAGTRIPLVLSFARKDLAPGTDVVITIEDILSGQTRTRTLRLLAPGIR